MAAGRCTKAKGSRGLSGAHQSRHCTQAARDREIPADLCAANAFQWPWHAGKSLPFRDVLNGRRYFARAVSGDRGCLFDFPVSRAPRYTGILCRYVAAEHKGEGVSGGIRQGGSARHGLGTERATSYVIATLHGEALPRSLRIFPTGAASPARSYGSAYIRAEFRSPSPSRAVDNAYTSCLGVGCRSLDGAIVISPGGLCVPYHGPPSLLLAPSPVSSLPPIARLPSSILSASPRPLAASLSLPPPRPATGKLVSVRKTPL